MSIDDSAPEGAALAELVRDDSSRRRFLKLVGGGGAASLAALIAACGGDDSKQAATATPARSKGMDSGDLAIVNYALTLEYLEADFYAAAVSSRMFKGSQQSLLQQIADSENQHVDALTATAKQLGGTPAPRPKTKFPLESKGKVVQLAATVENLGAAAYLGQAAAIQSKEILAAALAIHSVEARHAAALNLLAGKTITPDGAFGKPASMEEVLPQVKPFIVG
jgi:rubrerythrin